MVNFIKFTDLLLLILFYQEVRASVPIDTLLNVGKAAKNIYNSAKILWSGVKELKQYYSSSDNASRESLSIMRDLKYFEFNNLDMEIKINDMHDVLIDKLTESVHAIEQLNHHLSKISENSIRINSLYTKFLQYLQPPINVSYNKDVLLRFAKDVTTLNFCGLYARLNKINGMLINHSTSIHTQNTVELLLRYGELFLQYTRTPQSQQQFYNNLLNSIINNEIRAYVIINYGYSLLQKYQTGNYSNHINKYERDFKIRISDTLRIFKSVMEISSLELSKGDPPQHIEEKTYTQLRNVFQAFLINEIDINYENHCWSTCTDYSITMNISQNCYKEAKYCTKQRPCKGDLLDCGYAIKSGMEICLSDRNSSRRYEYLIDGSGVRNGLDDQECTTELVAVDTFMWLWNIFKPANCEFCTCICDGKDDNSDRYFSTESIVTRYTENYVVTGARFVKKNNVVYIQLQEGQLLPNGQINDSTVSWIPLPSGSISYFVLEWKKAHEITLDDIKVNPNQAIVGLKLIPLDTENRRLHFAILSQPINFTAGTVLANSKEDWISALHSSYKINIDNSDIPTRSKKKNAEKSHGPKYLTFQPSGIAADVGQSTLPFIDTQNITTIPAVPLSGIGIYHRRRISSGGFLALRLFTYDVSNYIEPN